MLDCVTAFLRVNSNFIMWKENNATLNGHLHRWLTFFHVWMNEKFNHWRLHSPHLETKRHMIFTSHVIGCFYMCTQILTYENKVTHDFFHMWKKGLHILIHIHTYRSLYLPHVVLFAIDDGYLVFFVGVRLQLLLPHCLLTHKAQEGVIRSMSYRWQNTIQSGDEMMCEDCSKDIFLDVHGPFY